MCESLESEKSKYEELKEKQSELLRNPEFHNQTSNQVENTEILFNKVLQQAVVKQHSLEKAAMEFQSFEAGVENLNKVLTEIEDMLSLEKTELSDGELKESIELCQVCKPTKSKIS